MPSYRFEFPDDPTVKEVTLDFENDEVALKEGLKATTEAMLDKIAIGTPHWSSTTLVYEAKTNRLLGSFRLPVERL